MIHNHIQCKVHKIIQVSNTVSEITLMPSTKLSFMPGQYIYVYLNTDKSLPYSIASSPIEDYIQLLVFHGKNEENISFFYKNLNAYIDVGLPEGRAYFRHHSNVMIGIGKGLGISPIRSIINYLIDTKSSLKVFIFYVIYSEDEIIIGKYFEALVNKYVNKEIYLDIEYKPIKINGRYDLEKLYGNLVLLNKINLLSLSDFYVFGSNDFVTNIYNSLLPFCKDNFFTDAQLIQKVGGANEK